MSKNKILRHYVSSLDQFLHQFDKEHPELSTSQKKEVAKYTRIYELRDNPLVTTITKLPEDF